MANINYRAEAFQKCRSRCTICVKTFVFPTCQLWGGNRLHTCLFCVCLSLIICDDSCMCSIRCLSLGLVFSTIRQTIQAKVLKQRSLRYAFVRDRSVLCLFIYGLYSCAAPGESVASDNELITWFIYGLLLGSPPNTTWFSCSVEHGALFLSSRLEGVCIFSHLISFWQIWFVHRMNDLRV